MRDDEKQVRARVFISCGQNKGTEEVSVANAIGERLGQLGFDHYIAVQEQSLTGLKENIFEQLRRSEYFIFVDFKRELLAGTDPPRYRGSLFSHQELAVAAYLNLPVLAFQESGVKQADGILGFLQANATQFSDRHLLASVIGDQVQQRCWDPHWKDQIIIEGQAGHADVQNSTFFHVTVRNLHCRGTAINCYVYLEEAIRLDSHSVIPLEAIELKWAGYTQPNVNIPARKSRRFDAFHIAHSAPEQLRFTAFSDWGEVIPRIAGEGEYQLTYLIQSENFPPARRTFVLQLSPSLGSTVLKAQSD